MTLPGTAAFPKGIRRPAANLARSSRLAQARATASAGAMRSVPAATKESRHCADVRRELKPASGERDGRRSAEGEILIAPKRSFLFRPIGEDEWKM